MNKTKKIFLIMLIINFILIIFSSNVMAYGTKGTDGVSGSGSSGSTSSTAEDIEKLQMGQITPDSGMTKMISTIFGVVQYICIAAAVIIIMVSGVKYMISAPDQKADIKKQSISLVIGATIIFSISTILRIIANIVKSTF